MIFALMCSNCALRSGCRAPSSALRLCWREKPSFTSSLRTVSALIGCPIAVSASASLSMLFDTQISGRIGSPRVAGSTRRFSAGTSPGSVVLTALRPAPERRTLPLANGAASRSSSPRLMVERARPVIRETTARLPQPAALTSPAANNRRPRSSSFEPTVSQRVRMASSSIMPSELRLFVRNRNPSDLSHSAARSQNAIQLLFGVSLGADPALDEGRFVTAALGRTEELAVGVYPLPPVVQPLQICEAHAAVHLGREPGDLAANVVKVGLGLQGRDPCLVWQSVLGVGRKPDKRTARLKGGRKIGQRVFDALE